MLKRQNCPINNLSFCFTDKNDAAEVCGHTLDRLIELMKTKHEGEQNESDLSDGGDEYEVDDDEGHDEDNEENEQGQEDDDLCD